MTWVLKHWKLLSLSLFGLVAFISLSYLTYLGIDFYFQRQTVPTKPEQSILPPQVSKPLSLIDEKTKLIGNASSTREVNGLRVQVNQVLTCSGQEIKVYSSITDKEGKAVSDIKPADFTLSLDNTRITNFDFEIVEKQAISLGVLLAIDHSGSMTGEPLSKAKEAANTFLDTLSSTDQVGLIKFNEIAEVLQDLTVDKSLLKNSLEKITAQGNTAFYDAVAASVDKMSGCGRKAIIILTDGRDTSSKKYGLPQVVNKANKESVPVYVVGLKSNQFTPTILSSIAQNTGGQYFEAATPQDLAAIYTQISDQIKGQYVFTIKDSFPKNGKEHVLKLTSKISGVLDSESASSKSFIF